MKKVFICSPYRGDTKKNLGKTISYCRMADIHCKLPIAPHVFFTRIFPEEDTCARATGMCWGKDLMQYCSEIWVFCNELTDGMVEEIAEAKKLGLKMKFHNTNKEEINSDNYLIHGEIGPAYRKLIAEHFGDRFYFEGECTDCSYCRRSAGTECENEDQLEDEEDDFDDTVPRGIFDWLFKRK